MSECHALAEDEEDPKELFSLRPPPPPPRGQKGGRDCGREGFHRANKTANFFCTVWLGTCHSMLNEDFSLTRDKKRDEMLYCMLFLFLRGGSGVGDWISENGGGDGWKWLGRAILPFPPFAPLCSAVLLPLPRNRIYPTNESKGGGKEIRRSAKNLIICGFFSLYVPLVAAKVYNIDKMQF